MTKLINRTVDIVFLGMLAMIVFAMAFTITGTVLNGVAAYIAGAILLVCVLFFVIRGRQRITDVGRRIKKRLAPIPAWKMALFLGLFSAVTKVILVFVFDNNADLDTDMAMYRSFAQQFAEYGKIVEGTEYAYKHTYTAFFGLLLSPFAKLFGADTKVFTVALSVLHSVALVLMFDMLKQYVKKELAFVVLFLYSVLPMGLLQTQVLMHENGLFFLHILSLWLFMRAFRKNTHWVWQLLLVFAAGIVLAAGKSVNAAGRVFFISFGIFAVAKCFSQKVDCKRLLALLSTVGILIACFYVGNGFLSSLRQNVRESSNKIQGVSYSYPYGWDLYVGMNYESGGIWTKEDKEVYYQYMMCDSREEAIEYQKGLLSQRAQMYKDDPIKIPIQLFRKFQKLWGSQRLPFAYDQGNAINSFVLHGMGGMINKSLTLMNNFIFLLLYGVLFVAQWKKCRKKDNEVGIDLHFRMGIIGITLALLVFEVALKHVSHLHICLFATLACYLKYYLDDGKGNASENGGMVDAAK